MAAPLASNHTSSAAVIAALTALVVARAVSEPSPIVVATVLSATAVVPNVVLSVSFVTVTVTVGAALLAAVTTFTETPSSPLVFSPPVKASVTFLTSVSV